MARGRMINRTVGEDIDLARYAEAVGPWGLVFHHRLLAWIDKNGNVNVNGEWLKGRLFVYDSGVTPDDCRKFAGTMPDYIRAIPYHDDDGRGEYLHFPSFGKNQIGLRFDRELSEYPEYKAENSPCRNHAGTMPEPCRKESGVSISISKEEVEVEGEVEVKKGSQKKPRACTREGIAPFPELRLITDHHKEQCFKNGVPDGPYGSMATRLIRDFLSRGGMTVENANEMITDRIEGVKLKSLVSITEIFKPHNVEAWIGIMRKLSGNIPGSGQIKTKDDIRRERNLAEGMKFISGGKTNDGIGQNAVHADHDSLG